MAFPLTHTALSLKVFDKYFSDKDVKEFIIGTNLPDIRYLGVIEREKTHFPEIQLDEITKKDSFQAGLLFHSLVDRVREDYVIEQGYYDIAPKSENEWVVYTSIKFLEDVIISKYVNNWDVVSKYFDTVLPAEVEIGIKQDTVIRWHKMLQNHIASFTSVEAPDGKLLEDMGIKSEVVDALLSYVDQISKIPKVLDIVNGLYDNFDQLLK